MNFVDTTTKENPMNSTTTYVTTPNNEQLEAAWFALMQGELGIDHDHAVAEIMQMMLDHVRQETDRGMPVYAADGEPLSAVSSDEMAKRMVAAYACLFYGA